MKWMRAGMTLVGPNAGDMTIGKSIGSQSLNYTIISASVDDNGWHTCIGDSALIGVSHTAESNVYVHVQGEIDLRWLYISFFVQEVLQQIMLQQISTWGFPWLRVSWSMSQLPDEKP